MGILFIPALLNWGMGWGIWYWLFLQLESSDQATWALQDYLAGYVPFLLLAMLPFYWKQFRPSISAVSAVFYPSDKGILQDVFTAFIWAGVMVVIALLWWEILGVRQQLFFIKNTGLYGFHLAGMVIVAPVVEEIIFRG